MKEKQHLIFFTGAGISLESGIPTFAEQDGLRNKLTRDYALTQTTDYVNTIKTMRDLCQKAEPNAAHKAIASLNVPVITMNIDGLHEKAGSKNVNAIHGRFPTDEEISQDNFKFMLNVPVLYGDPAPRYEEARRLVNSLKYKDSVFVIIGTSFYTTISMDLKERAVKRGAKIILINEDATTKVPELVERLKIRFNL